MNWTKTMVFINGTFHISELPIGCWNINGIWKRINTFRYNKLNDPYVQKILFRYKIFGLIETHHVSTEEANLQFDGFKCFSICRPKRKKASGGLSVYVHSSLRVGVSKVPLPGTECIILKLKKDFFGLLDDVFVCFAYCLPYNSPVAGASFMPSDTFEDLETKLAGFASVGSTILSGDMNARTLGLPYYIIDDESHHVPIPPPEIYTPQSGLGVRENQDSGQNSYGPKFLELCKKVNLRILNGRTLGDLTGKLTCFTGRDVNRVAQNP